MGAPAGMAPRLGYAVAAAGLLALCCVVTVHVNDETIRAEATVVAEHDGMMFEHEDHDSDDLSEADRQLIAAAGSDDDDDVPVQKFSELKNVQNKGDKNRKDEDKEDDLSPEEEAMINAANKKIPKDETPVPKRAALKKVKKAVKKVAPVPEPEPVEDIETETQTETEKPRKVSHKHSSAGKDDLSPEEQALINAANNNAGKKPKKVAKKLAKKKSAPQVKLVKKHLTKPVVEMPSPKVAKVSKLAAKVSSVQSLKAQVADQIEKKLEEHKQKQKRHAVVDTHFTAKPYHQKLHGEDTLRQTDDSLSEDEKSLIEAARHEDPRKLQRAKMQLGVDMPAIEAKLDVRRTQIPKVQIPQTDGEMKKDMMKKAMEKITKAAAHKAVMAATTTLPEVHAAAAAHAVTPEPASKSKRHMSLGDARAVVYGMSAHHLPALHEAEPSFEHHDTEEAHEAPLKSVAEMRRLEKEKLRAKFQKLETQSSKAADDDWQHQLEAADHKAAAMATHRAAPLSPQDIFRARLMRRNLAAQYRANSALHFADDEMDATPTMPMDAHSVISSSP